MSKVIALELLVPEGQVLVVKEVMGHIVKDISKDTSAEDSNGHKPVPVENRMCQMPERGGQHDEEGRRHDKTVLVHGQVMMNTMEEEVHGNADSVIRDIPAYRSAYYSNSSAGYACTYPSRWNKNL